MCGILRGPGMAGTEGRAGREMKTPAILQEVRG